MSQTFIKLHDRGSEILVSISRLSAAFVSDSGLVTIAVGDKLFIVDEKIEEIAALIDWAGGDVVTKEQIV